MSKLVQFYSNRIVITNAKDKTIQRAPKKSFSDLRKIRALNNLKTKKSTINLSASSKRNLKESINSMYILSSPRKIERPGKKTIFNFRQSFITLTLPSKQIHTDVEIKKCLNNFFGLLRKFEKVENYVWRAELQKNENIHFHLVLDMYVDYATIRHYWNLSINKLGYVDRYQTKMKQHTLTSYRATYNLDFKTAAERYAKGCKNEWSTPPSVDVFSVKSDKDVAFYISKYFSKDTVISKDDKKNVTDDEKNILEQSTAYRYEIFGRVWARSQSLSRLKFRNKMELSEIDAYLTKLVKSVKGVFKRTFDYCTIIYFQLNKLSIDDYNYITFINRNNAKRYNYPFPT